MATEPYLYNDIPSGEIGRDHPAFGQMVEYKDRVMEEFRASEPMTFVGRWLRARRLKHRNQIFAQYGWNVTEDGDMVEVRVKKIVAGPTSVAGDGSVSDARAQNRWTTGRIQVRAGYVVDTKTGLKVDPTERFKLKAQLG